MTDIYSLEDKISNIRKVVRNLTGDNFSTFDYKPSLLQEINSNSSRSLRNSLENFLEGKIEEAKPSRPAQAYENPPSHTFDYSKDNKYSNNSFKGPYSHKIMTSFLSDEFSSLKFNEKENSDLGLLLEHERENIKKLEQRLMQKDEIIASMNSRQAALADELAALKRTGSVQEVEEYKVLVGTLQDKLEKYANQVNFLQNRALMDGKDEEVFVKMAGLQRQLREQEGLFDEVRALEFRMKQDQVLISDLKYQIEKKDKHLVEVINENKELLAKLNELNSAKKDPRQDFREFKLKEEVTRLKQVNEELFEKFRKIESEAGFKRSIHKEEPSIEPHNYSHSHIHKLINPQDQNPDSQTRGRQATNPEDQNRVHNKSSNDRTHKGNEALNEKNQKRSHSNPHEHNEKHEHRQRSRSHRRAFGEIVKILQCSSSEVIDRIKTLKRSQQLKERLAKLISDLTYARPDISNKDIWTCIRKLVEDYVVIKKAEGSNNAKIAKLLGVSEAQAFNEVRRVVDEKKNMNQLVNKIKKMLCLSPSAPLREVEDTIDEKV